MCGAFSNAVETGGRRVRECVFQADMDNASGTDGMKAHPNSLIRGGSEEAGKREANAH